VEGLGQWPRGDGCAGRSEQAPSVDPGVGFGREMGKAVSWRDKSAFVLVARMTLLGLVGAGACNRMPQPMAAASSSTVRIPCRTGENEAGLTFDSHGADFTVWINHFRNEVHRTWTVPQETPKGGVDFEFTVERDGSMSALRVLRSSGTLFLVTTAQDALTGSHWMPLPDDYKPHRVTMQASFCYWGVPQARPKKEPE